MVAGGGPAWLAGWAGTLPFGNETEHPFKYASNGVQVEDGSFLPFFRSLTFTLILASSGQLLEV